MIAALGRWLLGGGVSAIGGQLRAAYEAKLKAQNDAERIAAEQTIARLEASREIAVIEASDRWSATRIGRLLIVVPFGVWWTMIFVDSVIAAPWDVLDLPPRVWSMAEILIPAILIADAGALVGRRWAAHAR